MSVIILGLLAEGGVQLPFYWFKFPTGVPSPTAVHLEQHISIGELLGIRAPHVYLVRIEGRRMEGGGISTLGFTCQSPGIRSMRSACPRIRCLPDGNAQPVPCRLQSIWHPLKVLLRVRLADPARSHG